MRKYFTDSFYSNSAYLIIASLLTSALGLIFWIVAARLYPKEDLGLATVIISILGLIINMSRLGFDKSLIRFLPQGNRSNIFYTSLFVTTGFALLIGVALIKTTSIWSPNLVIGDNIHIPLLILVILQSAYLVLNNTFVALRKANIGLIQNIIIGTRLIFLLPFIAFGTIGILLTWIVSLILVIIISIHPLLHLGINSFQIDLKFLKDAFRFSMGNYFFSILSSIPYQILPIFVLNQLGAGSVASYYIAFSITSIASVIPMACNTSLFVEGSHGEQLKKNVMKSITTSICLLIPVIAGIYLGGEFMLNLIGKEYATEGLGLLKLLLLSSILIIPYMTYNTILIIQKNMKMLILFGFVNCASITIFSYSLLDIYGLNGIGYAFILTSLLSSLFTLMLVREMRPEY